MLDLNQVRVTQQPQQLDLPKDAGCVRDMIKDINDLLDSHTLTSLGVDSGSNNTVATFADDFTDLIPACLAILCKEFSLLKRSSNCYRMLDGVKILVQCTYRIIMQTEKRNTAFQCKDTSKQELKLQRHEPTGGHFVILSGLVWIKG